MAEINFLPVCSNCKKVILTEVGIAYVDDFVPNHYLHERRQQVYPYHCPYCHEKFDLITLPKTIPQKDISCFRDMADRVWYGE